MARILRTSALALAAAIVWQAPAAAQLTATTPAWSPAQVEIMHKDWHVNSEKGMSLQYNRRTDTIVAIFEFKNEKGVWLRPRSTLKLLPNGTGFYGDLVDDANNNLGKIEMSLVANRMLSVTGTGVNGSYAALVGKYYGTTTYSDVYFQPFMGKWKTNGYELTFTSREGMMIGTLERVVPNQLPEVIRNYAFSIVVSTNADRLRGGASDGSGSGPGAATEIAFGADKNQLIVHSISASRGDISDSYKRVVTPSSGQTLPVTAGMPEPKPGYTACARDWCRVKIASAKIFLAPGWQSNTFYPVLALTTKLHNVSPWATVLRPTGGAVVTGGFRFLAGTDTAPRAEAPSGASMGPMPKADFSNGWPKPIGADTDVPIGSEVTADFWLDSVPAGSDRLWLSTAGAVHGAIEGAEAKDALCQWYRKAADLKAQNMLAERAPFKGVPDFCGGGASPAGGTGAGGGGAADGPGSDAGGSAGGGTGSSAGGTGGSTGTGSGATGGGGSSSSSGGGSSGGSSGGVGRVPTPAERGAADPSQDGDFRALLKFGVKMEIAEARGDGAAFQVIAQVRNRTATPIYLTSGMMRVAVTDGDGVAVDTGQFVRASGEPPQLFASTPVVQPGGVIRLRWILRPNEVDSIQSVTFTEGSKAVTIPVGG